MTPTTTQSLDTTVQTLQTMPPPVGVEPMVADAAQAVAHTAMQTAAPIMPHAESSVSIWSLFWGATPVVKLVMLLLVVASVWSWTIIFNKVSRLRQLNKDASYFEETFWSCGSLDDLYDRLQAKAFDPMSLIFCTAMKEWRRSFSKVALPSAELRATMQHRIERVMHIAFAREVEGIERHMTFLATLGSTGMIIGLFGTVIGIMNSFQAIASQHNANLAVVAPGIAEALFATAIGLVAAIPAMIAYNKLSGDINRYAQRIETFMGEFSSIISRQLEEVSH